MKIYNICTKKTYQKEGQDKTIWLNCGALKQTDEGKMFIQLNHLPDITFYVFEPKKKEGEGDSF